MKIINYKAFVAMPAGMLYRSYEPMIFGELEIKQQTINDGNDWFLNRLNESFQSNEENEYDSFEEQCKKLQNGESLKGDYTTMERDGMFDYDRSFLVYDKEDINDMINVLKQLI